MTDPGEPAVAGHGAAAEDREEAARTRPVLPLPHRVGRGRPDPDRRHAAGTADTEREDAPSFAPPDPLDSFSPIDDDLPHGDPYPSPGFPDRFASRSGPVVRAAARGGGPRGGGSRPVAGLVELPEEPRPDPRSVVLADPRVPEHRRRCPNAECDAPVGRSRGEGVGGDEGRCGRCGRRYGFVPRLRAGEWVGGQYEVVGCLAHGGQGWIYLAVDHPVSRRWVVLKGLRDTEDEDALASAIAERRFLAEIEHPGIVRIHNFVEHPDPRSGTPDGYIVMEYAGGRSLREIADARRGPGGPRPLPLEQACAHGIEALDALGHLHDRGLLYCDFKPANVIRTGHRLKLIDLGAVRRIDETTGTLYGTPGYQAPEVPELGVSVASDLHTVAVTLAELGLGVPVRAGLPEDDPLSAPDTEVPRTHASFHRLVVRGTDPDPALRFASAAAMAEQLTGVLREVVALTTGVPRPAVSTLFGPERRVVDTTVVSPSGAAGAEEVPVPGTRRAVPRRRLRLLRRRPPATPPGPPVGTGGTDGPPDLPAPGGPPGTVVPDLRESALALPAPRLDPEDPCAGFLTGLPPAGASDTLTALRAAPAESVELRLRRTRALLELPLERPGDPGVRAAADDGAARLLVELDRHAPGDPRVVWYRGVAALCANDPATAARCFGAVHDAFPGEPAPGLALGVCAEALGGTRDAEEWYAVVWATDPGHHGAGFGLARVRLAAGDRAGAVEALESVPETSVHRNAARVAAVRARLRGRDPRDPLLPDLLTCGRRVAELRRNGVEPALAERLSCEVLGVTLDWWLAGRAGAPEPASEGARTVLGHSLDETGIRSGLERSYRVLARLAASPRERIELVETANRLRPRTWV
ncbi:serine/threonine-protein kinase [Streptomyces sp. ST2-7A]|uniref:serine/threonine-protein kinase n=1 Tax=Streptomyces sp. ST2-7A TaxID=2907214 RepID=UPI001F47C3BC|nr:serine/threonine-protein kinase [Streptomyces sp. ST2-7A]MCE7079256.1 serine/threonine-protein kinase PknG [Streptomyces sp. ST2-7A]